MEFWLIWVRLGEFLVPNKFNRCCSLPCICTTCQSFVVFSWELYLYCHIIIVVQYETNTSKSELRSSMHGFSFLLILTFGMEELVLFTLSFIIIIIIKNINSASLCKNSIELFSCKWFIPNSGSRIYQVEFLLEIIPSQCPSFAFKISSQKKGKWVETCCSQSSIDSLLLIYD